MIKTAETRVQIAKQGLKGHASDHAGVPQQCLGWRKRKGASPEWKEGGREGREKEEKRLIRAAS